MAKPKKAKDKISIDSLIGNGKVINQKNTTNTKN